MASYDFSLFGFVVINSSAFFWQRRQNDQAAKREDLECVSSRISLLAARAAKWQLKAQFFPVYLLVLGADWLQVCLAFCCDKYFSHVHRDCISILYTKVRDYIPLLKVIVIVDFQRR